jgi:hypothetical protein
MGHAYRDKIVVALMSLFFVRFDISFAWMDVASQ